MSIGEEVIICYDIEDNKSRTKLFDTLKDFGLRPVQKSVFWGVLVPAQLREVKLILKDYLDERDRGFIIKCKTQDKKSFYSVNYSPEDFINKKHEAI